MHSDLMAQAYDAGDLVDGEPMINPVRQAVRHGGDVVGKPGRAVRILPAAAFKEGLRIIPVE